MIIKYPNWYEHFQYLGYNLEDEPRIFDGVYTGAETRDPINGTQHLQQYEGYDFFRYLENIKPGANGGGWVDPGGFRDKERYAEELTLPLFAKAPEITLFDFRQQLVPMRGAASDANGPKSLTAFTGSVFEQVDGFLGKLGKPIGVKSYKPFHSSGEDFLDDYLGMIGIPVEMTPTFPEDAPTVLLTETAKFDPAIFAKIKKQLTAGRKVVITSGLLKALQGKGIEDIAELEVTDRRALVRDFPAGFFGRGGAAHLDADILIPEIRYATNDAWEIVSAAARGIGYPLLLTASYSKGTLFVLTIPDNFGDLYNLPQTVLTPIRNAIAGDLPVRLDSPGQVGLFVYDNGKFIVENFLAPGGKSLPARVSVDRKFSKLVDVVTSQQITGQPMGDRMVFDLTLEPATYRVFSAE
jgi:hypothetical protein